MTTAYTSLLGLALPVTGELSGTWGDTVNDYITQYLDASVAGTQTISGSQTAVTLSKTTNASLSQAGSGATGSSQYNVINCTGNPASMLTVTVPAASKTYVVVNATSTNQDVKIVGAGPTTGVTLVAGERAIIAWNGSDFIKVATSTVDGVSTISFGSTGLTPSTATSGAVTVAGTLVAANGGTGQSSYTTGDLLYATGSTALSKLGIGTNGQILTSTGTAPQWSTLSGVAVTTFSAGTTGFTPSSATSGAVTLAGTLATTNGGTGLTSFTANGVVYASSTSALTTGSALTFDGTNLGVGTASPFAAVNQTSVTINAPLYPRVDFYSAGVQRAFLNSGSTDTNLYTVGNTPLTFGINNAEAMRLTSTGLGIGTSSPSTKLHVTGSVANGAVTYLNNTDTANGNGLFIRAGGSNAGKYALAVENAAASSLLVLEASGNVGIGTSSPSYRLDVQAATAVAQVKSTTGTNAAYYVANNTGGDFYIGRENSAGTTFGTTAYSAVLWSAGAYPMSFFTNGTERMRLDSSGNLGIGTSSPRSVLDLNTTRSVKAYWGTAGTLGETQSTAGDYIANNLFVSAESAGTMTYTKTTGDSGNAILQDFSRGITFYTGVTGAATTTGTLNNFERMRLDSSGNLGLGVTPSAWGMSGSNKAFQNLGGGLYSLNTQNLLLSQNSYYNGTNNIYVTTSAATIYQQSNGSHIWFTAPSGTEGTQITNFITAMTLDASSSLNIDSGTGGGRLTFQPGATQNQILSTTTGFGAYNILRHQASQYQWLNASSTQMMTLTSGGTLAVGYTSASNGSAVFLDSIGIGTTSPLINSTGRTVHIHTSTNNHWSLLHTTTNETGSGGADGTIYGQIGLDGYMFNYEAGNLIFGTNSAERARITSGGNVSIGGTADRGTTVGSAALQLFNGTAPAGTLTNGVSLYSQSGDLRFMDAAGNAYPVGFRNIPQSGSAKTTSYTLATTDVGEYIQVGSGGSVTIPDATFATGDVVSVFNNTTGNITITCSITTAYIAGTDSDKATMTLATRGVATILFISSTVCVVTGNVT